MTGSERPIRVAVIGSGCAAMTTAYELSRPEHGGRFDVTVYQLGFRCGGKGASGRGPHGRIEEHGLHLWMGFYENAFRLMRDAYGELGRDPATSPVATWRDALEPAPWVAVVDRTNRGDWEPWLAHFPPCDGTPGDPPTSARPFSVRAYLIQAATLVGELVRSAGHRAADGPTPERPPPADGATALAAMLRLLRYGRLAGSAALFEAADLLRIFFELATPELLRRSGPLLPLLDELSAFARRRLASLLDGDVEAQRVWHVVDVILAILRGATVEGLAVDPRGFDALNDHEWLTWLRRHGALEESLRCGFVRGIYDLVFAYKDGDQEQPRLAAGVALRGSMRMFFTYRGALFWRMTAGMGDIVFTPLYEVMKRRGVRFRFFHRLENIGVDQDSGDALPHVSTLRFAVQAELENIDEYAPLKDVKGLPCWPSEPDWDQLKDGERLRAEGVRFEDPWEQRVAGHTTLHVGEDFDAVVLGVGLGAVPLVARELIASSPKWRAMVDHCETVATQSLQLWTRESMAQLGWLHPQINLSGYVVPFDTWADMRHLIPREDLGPALQGIAYFVSVLPDEGPEPGEDPHEHYLARHAQVRSTAIRFLETDIAPLWPKAVSETGFRWEVLLTGEAAVDPALVDGPAADGSAVHPIDTQFWMSNVNPTDRYSLSTPGSIQHRISPLQVDFDNLTVCGDWTRSGLDSGCVESAVMSGLLAAHALSGSPALPSIVGYDHP
jgi:uncharacterized protein with NAD-binding domain and iron-sulfur cluster